MRTHGPYHRHKSTKGGLLCIIARDRNRVSTRPALGGARHFILTTAVSSFARAQEMDNPAVAHHTTGGSTCPTLRGAKHFPSTPYFFFFMLDVSTVSTYFYYTKAILMGRKYRNNSRTTTAFNYCIRKRFILVCVYLPHNWKAYIGMQ